MHCFHQYKTVYKKTIYTKNVTVTLNLTDSLNATEAALAANMSRVLQTIQVGDLPQCQVLWGNKCYSYFG